MKSGPENVVKLNLEERAMSRIICWFAGHSLIDFGHIFLCRRCRSAWKGLR